MGLQLRLDVVGGISGDMFIAAMADCFPQYRRDFYNFTKKLAIPGLRVSVRAERGGVVRGSFLDLRYSRCDLVSYRDFDRFLRARKISTEEISIARGILRKLAQAEARVHSCDVLDVHFHEIADWDTVVDCLLTAYWINKIKPSSMSLGCDLPIGLGIIETSHGAIPVPSPATTELLKDYRFRFNSEKGEAITPTGAAIIASFFNDGPTRLGRLVRSGCGYGTRLPKNPSNFCRITIFREDVDFFRAGVATDTVGVVTAEVDDQTPEDLSIAVDLLRRLPFVLSVSTWTGLGKKGRPVFRVEMLCLPDSLGLAIEALFCETSTIGLRYQVLDRSVLTRAGGRLANGVDVYRYKESTLPNGTKRRKIENDCLKGVSGFENRNRLREKAGKRK